MSQLINIFMPSFSEIILAFLFVQKSTNKPYKQKWYSYLLLVVAALLITISKLLIPWPLVISIIAQIITYFSLWFLNKSSYIKLLIYYFFSFIFVIFFVETPILALIKGLQNDAHFMLIAGVILLIWGLILIAIMPLSKICGTLMSQSTRMNIIIANCAIIAVLYTWFFQIERESFFENVIFYTFFGFFVILINYELIDSHLKLQQEKKKIEAYDEYFPILNEMILEVRKKQHNHNDIIQTLINLPATHKTYEALAEALTGQDILAYMSSTPTYLLKTNLTIVAAYLYSKSKQAEAFGKNIDIEIDEKDLPTTIPQYELVELLGVLIENGLEAIPEGASMSVSIKNAEDGRIRIVSSNQGPIVGSSFLKDIFTPGYSTKTGIGKSSRGLGLPRLKNYVESKHGKVMVTNEIEKGVRMIVFTVEV